MQDNFWLMDSFTSAVNYINTLTSNEIFYNLYTRKCFNKSQIIRNVADLAQSNFDSTKMCLFIVPAWTETPETEIIILLKNTTLEHHDINVFIMDWSFASLLPIYPIARKCVRPIGRKMGEFITNIQNFYNLDSTHFILVGYSLGAHICANTGAKIDRIVVFDPARPQFDPGLDDGLNPSSANYVEVIHTGGGGVGMIRPIGHVDYYVNGGMYQHGCPTLFLVGFCDHQRSVWYFIESLKYGTVFEGVKCDTIENFEYGTCANNSRSVMGGLVRKKRDFGSYYLRTNEKYPYALGAGIEYRKHPLADTNIKLHNYFQNQGVSLEGYVKEIYENPKVLFEHLLNVFN